VSKIRRQRHWKAGGLILLSHPGCFLSYHRALKTMLKEIQKHVEANTLTVLVTHWWEFFRDGEPDHPFIKVLHQTAEWLSSRSDIKVVRFDDVAKGLVPLA
jgi:hypothetical protein